MQIRVAAALVLAAVAAAWHNSLGGPFILDDAPAVTENPTLRRLWQHGQPADRPYSSAWERGETSSAVAEEEWDRVSRSVHYFRELEQAATALA